MFDDATTEMSTTFDDEWVAAESNTTTFTAFESAATGEMNFDDPCWFIDRFIHEYFTALGLSHLSPFANLAAEEWDESAFPFTTFDDMIEVDVVEVPVDDQDPLD